MYTNGALGLLLALRMPCVAGVPLSHDEIELVVEAKAHLQLDGLLDHLRVPEKHSNKEEDRPDHQRYVTLTVPGPTLPEPSTRYPEPGCERCFGTVIHREPSDTPYETVDCHGEGPYPTISKSPPECPTCHGKVYFYDPQQPKGGYPAPTHVSVNLDGARPDGPRITIPPLLPLDAPTVVYGPPGFEGRFRKYVAKGADAESAGRLVLGQDPREPVIIVGDPEPEETLEYYPPDGYENPAFTHPPRISLPPLRPGQPPTVVVNVVAGNGNGNGNGNDNGNDNGNSKVVAGNGVSSNSGGNSTNNNTDTIGSDAGSNSSSSSNATANAEVSVIVLPNEGPVTVTVTTTVIPPPAPTTIIPLD